MYLFSKKIRISYILSLLLLCQQSYGQNLHIVNGHVTGYDSKKPLQMVTVVIPSLNYWSITNESGYFEISKIPAGTYELHFRLLGFQSKTVNVSVKSDQKLDVVMNAQSLSLDEVTVTAKEKKTGSTSVINELSIEHLQAKSLEDILQLVPGNLTQNPSLNAVGQAFIREVSGTNSNNSLGTAVLVDGVPLSNDANLQNVSTSMSGSRFSSQQSTEGTMQTTAGRGVDLRTISPENIESVEVMRGIAGAEYGNLTSGAIIVKTRSGKTPLEVNAKTDEFSKMFYAGKGFGLGHNAGCMNLSLDYSQSYSDIRKKYEGYDRITSNLGYSNVFMKLTTPLSLDIKFTYFRSMNDEKSDPQMKTQERIYNKNSGFRVSSEVKWALNKKLISNIEYKFLFSQSHQHDYSKDFRTLSTGITPVADSYVDGEFVTRFLNASYYMESWVDGKPINIFTQIKIDKLLKLKNEAFSDFKAGAEWKYDVNKGDGLVFDPLYPPLSADVQTVRPRPYNDIPAMNVASAFLENKTHIPVGNTQLTLQAGVRFSNMFIDPSANRDDIFTVEPRFNGIWQIFDKSNNKTFDDLSVVGGFGISNKMPTLMHLYPDKAYFDTKSFSRTKSDEYEGIAVMTTKVIEDTSNPSLKPSNSKKFEIGLVGAKKKKSGNITFFYEKIKDEFGFSTQHFVMPYNSYSVPGETEDIYYENGSLYYVQNGVEYPATVTVEKDFQTYYSPDNRNETKKRGIEYSFSLGQLNLLKTSLMIDGAWLRVKRIRDKETYRQVTQLVGGEKYPYIGVMPAGSGSIESRLNTNFRFVTHIPVFKMIFSTTAQFVWFEQSQSIYKDKDGNDLYYKDPYYEGTSQEDWYWINPVGFWDKENKYHEWKPEYQESFEYRQMRQPCAHENYFGKEVFPIDFILNFRLTKEFGKIADFSFIANNFLNLANKHKYTTSSGYVNLSLPMYFGAEIKIKIH